MMDSSSLKMLFKRSYQGPIFHSLTYDFVKIELIPCIIVILNEDPHLKEIIIIIVSIPSLFIAIKSFLNIQLRL